MTVDPKSRLILALDMENPQPLVTAVGDDIAVHKTHAWSDDRLAEAIVELKSWGGKDPWADYKLKDTPDTVAKRAKKIREAGAKWITVHADGGRKMVRAAKDTGLYTIAVTLLTSLNDDEIRELYMQEPEDVVRKLQSGLLTEAPMRWFAHPHKSGLLTSGAPTTPDSNHGI